MPGLTLSYRGVRHASASFGGICALGADRTRPVGSALGGRGTQPARDRSSCRSLRGCALPLCRMGLGRTGARARGRDHETRALPSRKSPRNRWRARGVRAALRFVAAARRRGLTDPRGQFAPGQGARPLRRCAVRGRPGPSSQSRPYCSRRWSRSPARRNATAHGLPARPLPPAWTLATAMRTLSRKPTRRSPPEIRVAVLPSPVA